MKQIKVTALLVALTMNAYPCLVHTIINNSQTTDMLFRRIHIKGARSTEHGSLVLRRGKNDDGPRIVKAHNLGLGEGLEISVTEKSSYGHICKDYRILVDEKNEKLLLQKKDGCKKDWLSYETITELPMDPEDCFLDIYLGGDANSLTIRTVSGNDIGVYYRKEPAL